MIGYDAFVSYSRRDEALVKPVVKLLNVGKRKIFWDAQVEPGQKWMDSIAAALAVSETVIVIWCCHAAESGYVDAEVQTALARDQTVVPVLICPYPLREPLDEIQGVDFREVTKHSCLDGCAINPSVGLAGPGFDPTPIDPDAVSAIDVWLAAPKPSDRNHFRAFGIVGWLLSAIAAWATGVFTATPVSRESLHLAAVIETAIRRAERRHNVLTQR